MSSPHHNPMHEARSLLPSSPIFYGPPNPYNRHTVEGRAFMARRSFLGHPDNLDRWLQANMSLWPKEDPRSFTYLLCQDEVICEVELGFNKGLTTNKYDLDDPFIDAVDGERYELYLTISLPNEPTSAFPAIHPLFWHRKSPRAILASWYGAQQEISAPDWCRSLQIGEVVKFFQPRCVMVEAFACIALWDENVRQGLSKPMVNWSDNVSMVSQAKRTIRHGHSKVPHTPAQVSAPASVNHRQRRKSKREGRKAVGDLEDDFLVSSPLLK